MASSKIRKFKHNFGGNTPLNSAPALKPEIQTSLLQVGMRIRKSIGQGYRTQWALEEEKFRSERTRAYKSASQPILWEDKPSKTDDDWFPGSQESTSSIESNYTIAMMNHVPRPTRKRSYGKENDDDIQEAIADQMDAVSTCLRPIAQATSRRKFSIQRNNSTESVKKMEMLIDFDEASFLDPVNRSNETEEY